MDESKILGAIEKVARRDNGWCEVTIVVRTSEAAQLRLHVDQTVNLLVSQ